MTFLIIGVGFSVVVITVAVTEIIKLIKKKQGVYMFSVFIYIILAIFLLLTFWLFLITLSKRVLKCFIIIKKRKEKSLWQKEMQKMKIEDLR